MVVEDLARDGDRALAGDERRRSEGLRVIGGDEVGDLLAQGIPTIHSDETTALCRNDGRLQGTHQSTGLISGSK